MASRISPTISTFSDQLWHISHISPDDLERVVEHQSSQLKLFQVSECLIFDSTQREPSSRPRYWCCGSIAPILSYVGLSSATLRHQSRPLQDFSVILCGSTFFKIGSQNSNILHLDSKMFQAFFLKKSYFVRVTQVFLEKQTFSCGNFLKSGIFFPCDLTLNF